MDSEILERIQILNSATGEVTRRDLQNFPAIVLETKQSRFVYQDFSGGRSEIDMKRLIQSVVFNLGSFLEYLVVWGDKNGVSRGSIKGYLTKSDDYSVVLDLYNRDKHGGRAPRDGGYSRKKPELGNPRSQLRCKTQAKKNSVAGVKMGLYGQPVPIGDGTSEVIVTADVLDKNGNCLGELDKFVESALKQCESAVQHFQVKPS